MKRSQPSGFTLVELMVVVAMVGILSAIAIPQYSKFVAKARQSEAKIGLSAAFTALRSFAAENGSYSICLRQVGYVPDGPNNNCGPNRYYAIGFQESTYGQTNCGPGGNQSCASFNFAAGPGPGVACGPNVPCCNSGFVAGGGCNSLWTLSQSDYQYPANATMLNYSNTAFFPGHGHFAMMGTSIDQNHFTLGAAGNISSSGSSTCLASGLWFTNTDGWTIDEGKKLTNANPCL